jgi:hypothetical protein
VRDARLYSPEFYAPNYLANAVATMSGTDGAVLSRQQYYPFGAGRTGTAPERGYTGQQKEGADTSALGLYYYHARFYPKRSRDRTGRDPKRARDRAVRDSPLLGPSRRAHCGLITVNCEPRGGTH